MRADAVFFASSGGCADESSADCDCYNYGWTAGDLGWILQEMAAAGVKRLRVWRQDLTPPPGTLAHPLPWFTDAAAMWLNGSLA